MKLKIKLDQVILQFFRSLYRKIMIYSKSRISHAKIELYITQEKMVSHFFLVRMYYTQSPIYLLLPTLLEDFLIDSTYLKSKCIPLNCISSVFKITVAEIRCPRQSKDFRYSTEDMLSPMQKSTTQLLTFLDRPK